MPIGKPPTNAFKKGNSINKDFLAKLTPEEKKAFYDDIQATKLLNKKRRDNARVLNDIFMEKQIELLTRAYNATHVMLEKAIEEKDPQAYQAAMNRIYGMPQANIKQEMELSVPWDDEFGDTEGSDGLDD